VRRVSIGAYRRRAESRGDESVRDDREDVLLADDEQVHVIDLEFGA
jgi:hypothetical protein